MLRTTYLCRKKYLSFFFVKFINSKAEKSQQFLLVISFKNNAGYCKDCLSLIEVKVLSVVVCSSLFKFQIYRYRIYLAQTKFWNVLKKKTNKFRIYKASLLSYCACIGSNSS
jgi:hypothetical protein